MSEVWKNFAAVCGVLMAAELLARLCPKNAMVTFVKGLVTLALLASVFCGLCFADWEISLFQKQSEQRQEELSDYVSQQLESAAQEDIRDYFQGLLAAAGLEAEKIVLETDIGEDGSIVLKKAGFTFRFESDAQRARALLRNVLGEEIELEVQADGT